MNFKGTLPTLLLEALVREPSHGYRIAQRIKERSAGILDFKEGTLYPALVRLEQNGWISGEWQKTENNRDAKYYSLSKAGKKALTKETERWRRSAGLLEKLLLEGQ